ncbi:hypothetical protein OsJ_28409 [Oryza sativa Japonica Group]|uniref:Uncharacterized protein n=1 Tax=Oryza sativa subsp. japonica TaxID=39947 RepID=A3BW51_ORYSJ|nr:hypothetical protein OsJ_28409 [Oryza sativa Japonica Group]
MLPPSSPELEEDCLIIKIESCSRVFAFVDGAVGESGEERDAKTEALVEVLAAVRMSGKKQGLEREGMGRRQQRGEGREGEEEEEEEKVAESDMWVPLS